MRWLGKKCSKWSPILVSFVTAAIAYMCGIIVNYVSVSQQSSFNYIVLLAGGLVVCVSLMLFSSWIERNTRENRRRIEREHGAHRSGYYTLTREISEYTKIIRLVGGDAWEKQISPVELMGRCCDDLYKMLEQEYDIGLSVSEHIEFEVTFMTKSMKDGEITIASWANRQGQAPKSLQARNDDLHYFDDTEAYRLYKDKNRSVRFIESTERGDYKELYDGQKKRIKSSIVYPVSDDLSNLQGALVVHCDKEVFFREDAGKLWREFLEPYTMRLALARVAADKATEMGANPYF